MTNFRRWVDDDASDLRDLLRHARATAPLDATARARSRRRVAGLAAIPAASGALAWVGHAALGAVLGAAITAAITLPRALAPLRPVAEIPARAKAAPTTTLPHETITALGTSSPATPAPSETVARATPPAAPVEPSATAPAAPATRGDLGRSDPAPPDLSREAALLARAQRFVASAPSETLRLTREHATEFPNGALETEREFLAVEALLNLGKRSEAEARARALRDRSPSNLYNLRLDHLFSAGSNPGR